MRAFPLVSGLLIYVGPHLVRMILGVASEAAIARRPANDLKYAGSTSQSFCDAERVRPDPEEQG